MFIFISIVKISYDTNLISFYITLDSTQNIEMSMFSRANFMYLKVILRPISNNRFFQISNQISAFSQIISQNPKAIEYHKIAK